MAMVSGKGLIKPNKTRLRTLMWESGSMEKHMAMEYINGLTETGTKASGTSA